MLSLKQFIVTSIVVGITASCTSPKKELVSIDFTTDYQLNQEIETQVQQDTLPWKYQISAAAYASKGNYKNALSDWDKAMPGRERNFNKSQADSINQRYTVYNAVNYIVEQAQHKKVVMINEAHHNSYHRVFTTSLLQKLYDQGYKHLGLEALSYDDNLDSLQHIRKYPIQKTGYYIKDPQFGNMIREAIAIGYTLFPYETKEFENSTMESREINQAKNIQNYITTHPNDKFLIHCGFDHNLEGTHPSWGKTMAGRLTEYTGIDPLTIDQTKHSERGTPLFNSPLSKILTVQESSVILDQNDNVFRYNRKDAWNDIVVFHPNTTYVNDRPDWLFTGDYKNIDIPINDIEITYPVMVLAYQKDEDIHNAIPIDITEVVNNEQRCHLALKKGEYTIVITNKQQSVLFNQTVE